MKFAKPALTVEQPMARLDVQGMAVPDHARAAHYLIHVNDCRLQAYCPAHWREVTLWKGAE